jgi:cytochrome c oxidase assembly protein subunit 11
MSALVERRKRATAGLLAGLVVGMVGLAYASVPLYRLFCQVTGFGGTTQVATAAIPAPAAGVVTVRFDANVARGMPWRFRPAARSLAIRLGETVEATYVASNPTDRAITGTATFNVTPEKAGLYFTKIDCFCFAEQTLAPGQEVEMPVVFFVDPALADDPNTRDIGTITLSYTFFETTPEGAAAD